MEKDYYTVREAADYLGCSTKTIYRYLSDGKLEAQRFGYVWMIAKANLDALPLKQEKEQK